MVLDWCAGKANTVAEGSSNSCVTSVNLYLLLTPGTNSGTVRQVVESRRTIKGQTTAEETGISSRTFNQVVEERRIYEVQSNAKKLVLAAELLVK